MKRNLSLIGAAIAVLMLLHGCTQNTDNTNNGTTYPAAGEGTREGAGVRDTLSQVPDGRADVRRPDMKVRVRKGHALLLETEGFQLTAVDTAVRHEGVYSVTSLVEEDLEPLPQGMKNMTAAAAGYRLLPGGEHFAPYAEVRVAYDPARLPLGYTPEDIYTSYYDTVSLAWVRLERLGIDTANREIVSATTHFTDFINELLQSPEMPETQAFVPTALTDLEAVSPLDGLTLIQPPTANNNGTANLTYPLAIPAGRGGMQPSLALTYSSTGGSGWLGVGWDIPVPAITLDTRWGVPRYDTTYETEIYMLNGEQLVAKAPNGEILEMPHRTNQQTLRSELRGNVQFYARTGDAHDSIIRHGDSPKNYWWEVIDRNGTTHYYGLYHDTNRCRLNPLSLSDTLTSSLFDTNTIIYDSTHRPFIVYPRVTRNIPIWRPYPAVLYDDRHNVARWMLAESRDLYGNTVRYYYDKATVRNRGAVGRQIYLDSISYTGYDEKDGYYTVVFCRTGNNTPDVPVSCNNGFKEITDQLLNSVYLKCGDSIQTIWHFETENSDSTNYKNRLTSITKIDTVGEIGMRGLQRKFCHCIQQDEDEYATSGTDSAYILVRGRDSIILDTVYALIPKYRMISDKCCLEDNENNHPLHNNTGTPLYYFIHDTLYYTFYDTYNDSLFYALYDSIYFKASYDDNPNGPSSRYRWYRYLEGYKYEARVDSIRITFLDSVSIPQHINPLFTLTTLKYAGTTTTFDYYNAPDSKSLFDDKVTIPLENSNKELHGFFLSDPLSALDSNNMNKATWLRCRATALGLSTSSGWNVGGAATVGLGPTVCLTNNGLGGNYTRSGSSSETQMTLVDLDGDGLNDKVYVKGNKVYFCRQIWDESNHIFSFDKREEVTGIHRIMASSSTSNTFGVQAALYASASASWTDTKSITSTYFADVNGDGLVDLVDNGQVYFNHCKEGGVPEFKRYSAVPVSSQDEEAMAEVATEEPADNACGKIIFDGAADSSINCQRVWVLIDKFTTDTNDRNMYTWLNEHLVDTMYKCKVYQEKRGLDVEVYHREWDCSYHDESPASDAVRVWVAPMDGNINITSRIQLRKDTTLSRIVSRHADGVVLSIQKTENIRHGTSSFDTGSVNILLNDILIDSGDYTMHVDSSRRDSVRAGDMLFFRLRSKSDYHFDDVYARFTIDYDDSSIYDPWERNKWHFDSQEDFVLSGDYYFKAPVAGRCEVKLTWNDHSENVTAGVFYNGTDYGSYGSVFNSEMSKGDSVSVVLSSDYDVKWGDVVCKPYITFHPNSDEELYDTIYSEPDSMKIDTSRFTAPIEGWLVPQVEISHDYSIYQTPLYRRLFGPMYKGWGQFAYHSDGADADTIKVERLIPLDMMLSNTNNNADGRSRMEQLTNHGPEEESFGQSESLEEFHASNENFYDPYSNNSAWLEMTPDAEHWAWVSYGHQNTLGRDTMSNSLRTEWYSTTPSQTVIGNSEEPAVNITRQVAVHDDPVPPAYHDTPAKAVNKVNRSKSHSWSVGFLGAGYSDSKSDNTIEIEYMDLNGDRYPDIIGTDKVQYSRQWGGIGPVTDLPTTLSHGSASHTKSKGLSYSASRVIQERTACSLQQNAFFSMRSAGSGSVSGGGNIGNDEAGGSWVDINGDGLPDFVYPDGHVMMNIGYDFVDDQKWGFTDVHKGVSGAISVGAGLGGSEEVTEILSGATNISQASIEAGACMDGSYNQTTHMLMDINGDGLPDKLWRELNNIKKILDGSDVIKTMVSYNLGNRRFSEPHQLDIGRFHSSATFNESLNLGLTCGFTAWVFKITVGANGCPYNAGVTQDYVQLADVNGDGLPDWVYSSSENEMDVRYNLSGKTNLLKSATNFTGSSIHLDYTLSQASYRQPSRGWLMTSVTTNDPLNTNGAQTSITEYSYNNPYYDRYERMSYGFDSVVTKQIDPLTHDTLRFVDHNYNNRSLMQRGKLTHERIYDRNRNLYIEKEMNGIMVDYHSGHTVGDQDCPTIAYPSREGIFTSYYEGSGTKKLETREVIVYDRYHNICYDTIIGDFLNHPDEGLVVYLTYYHNQPHNLIGLRESYKIRSLGSDPVRRDAHFTYNDKGKLKNQTIGGSMTYDFLYDNYGNLKWAGLPENDNGERVEYKYGYDNVVQTYPELIVNTSYDETMRMDDYNYLIGKPQKITDPGNNTMTYTYDFAGRLTSVRSPMNTSRKPSVINTYYVKNYCHHDFQPFNFLQRPINSRPYAVTEHYDDQGGMITETVVITDGFGRVLQTKKGLPMDGVRKMQVSGQTMVDPLGRTVKQYDPFVVSYNFLTLGNLETSSTAALIDSTTYDVLDRATEVFQPLGITTRYFYDIEDDDDHRRRFYTRITDPNGNVTHQYADFEGRQVQVTAEIGNGNKATTKMHYDNLGQLLWSQDPEEFTTFYGYDEFGRLKHRDHPDAGHTEYGYDRAGNITVESNPLGEIIYDYSYYRLQHKRYTYGMSGNDVTYIYGNSGNETGRVTRIIDGSGSLALKYDPLGNVISETRIIALPENNGEVYRFHMEYTYDSWGRMLNMQYPDGEMVEYTYLWGGDLLSMHGNNPYINEIRYNAFGQRDSIVYGNGTRAKYTYDALHRLKHLSSYTAGNIKMQDIDYTFDNASNIAKIYNHVSPIGSFAGSYQNGYKYDNLHRLVFSSGNNVLGNYGMNVQYSPSGRIAHKYYKTPSGALSRPVDMYYGYCDKNQPHAVRRIYDHHENGEFNKYYDFRWDKAGNLGQISIATSDAHFDHGRFLFWTEDNRLHTAVDDKYYSYYVYDHSGERRVKLTGESHRIDVNANIMDIATTLSTPTLYPSPYLVLSNKEYTKHYYAGADRVAACLGGGGLDLSLQKSDCHITEPPASSSSSSYFDPVYPGEETGNDDGLPDCKTLMSSMQKTANELFGQSRKQLDNRELEKNDPDCLWKPENFWETEEYFRKELQRPIEGIPERLYVKEVYVKLDEFRKNTENLKKIHHKESDYIYYYHGDHLGSASWITDHHGVPVQHLQYLPYGEPYVDQRTSGYSERFRFTGKERDEETGYSYFGARYMDHELMTGWLSVDPMADKYPSVSPYAYCAWNPVKLVDPDGREVILVGTDECRQKAIEMMSQRSGLSFTVDEKGKVGYSGKVKTEMDDYIANMIDNTEITVLLTVQESNYDKDGAEIYGGCFDGNKFKPGTTNQINCLQIVDLITAKENDLLVGESWLGQTIWHEIAEAFEGGVNSIKNQKEAEKAYADENNPEYIQAHNAASKIFPASRKPIIQTDIMGFMKYSKIIGYEFE